MAAITGSSCGRPRSAAARAIQRAIRSFARAVARIERGAGLVEVGRGRAALGQGGGALTSTARSAAARTVERTTAAHACQDRRSADDEPERSGWTVKRAAPMVTTSPSTLKARAVGHRTSAVVQLVWKARGWSVTPPLRRR